MDSSYVSISRQSGLLKELQAVANNIANISTTGFRREGMVFAEAVKALEVEGGSVSMATARVRYTDSIAGGTSQTGGALDMAIDGPGFFMVETPQGERLTRAGSFSSNGEGDLVTMTGYRVLDSGGAPIFIPPDAGSIGIAEDGTISANGSPISQVGVFEVEDTSTLVREDGVMFRAEGEVIPAENSRVKQGFLESSNVNPVVEIARLIEVQRAYEMGQDLLDKEDKRIRASIRTIGKTA